MLAIDDATLIECVKANKIYGVVLSSSWKDPETGKWRSWFRDARWGQPSAQHFRDLVDKAVAKLRRAVPQVKILHKFHSYLNILDDDVEKYRDSWMIDQNGKMLTSPPYRECFYPTMTNTFGKGLFEMIRKIMEEHKVDGIYWDEFIGPGAGYSMMIPHVTFDKWDGYTALIDLKSKKILKTAAKIRILSDPWVKEAIRRITSNGGLLLANAQPCMPYYNLIKFPRMVETNDRALRMLESNLYSPLGYTSGNTPSISVIRERLEYGGVPLRSSLNSKWPVMSLFFPLTPIEIHRGWLLAEERLITARSGKYAWDTKTAATLYKFNARGKQIEAKQVTVPAEGLDIVVPDDGLVILVRS